MKELPKIGQKWPKMTQLGPNLPKIDPKSPVKKFLGNKFTKETEKKFQ